MYFRPTRIVYPGGRQIHYDYGTGSGMNDRLSRIENLKDSGAALAAYTYLGAGMVVRIDYPQPDVMLDLWGGTSGTFDGFDQFGRVTDQHWKILRRHADPRRRLRSSLRWQPKLNAR